MCVLCVFSTKILSQTEYTTENEKDIYWQPDIEIQFSDYQATIDTNCVKYNEKYGVQMSSSMGFRGVVDVPKRHKRSNYDKAYFAPVFCRKCSCILSEDTLGLKVENLLFDAAEFYARMSRKALLEIHKTMNADNTNQMFFTAVKNKYEKEMYQFFAAVYEDVLFTRNDSAYHKWRELVDEFLENSEEYATTPKDCYRFVLGKPIDKGYIKAKHLVNLDFSKKEEEK